MPNVERSRKPLAESEVYGINLQMCIVCRTIVIVASPKRTTGGSVDLSVCPAVKPDYYTCEGKMVPIKTISVAAEIVEQLRAGLE